jgi:hypothetical protein
MTAGSALVRALVEILAERDVTDVMDLVFDQPLAAGPVQQISAPGRGRRAGRR